jgi:hypothetical protein
MTFQIRQDLLDKLIGLAQKAIDNWGEEAQLNMVEEESLELLLELTRRRRNRHDPEKILEENVDAFVMMVQLASMMGTTRFNAMLEQKLIRLDQRLTDYISHQMLQAAPKLCIACGKDINSPTVTSCKNVDVCPHFGEQ